MYPIVLLFILHTIGANPTPFRTVRLAPPRRLSLEQTLAYIQDDELFEVTPRHIRMRKRLLDPVDRKRAARAAAADVA